jgi:uncharacterized coiled-coil protein SlyX
MSKWTKQDHAAWESSIVAKEYEKHMEGLIEKFVKIAQQGVAEKAKQTQQSLDGATKSAEKLLKTVGETNLADDSSSILALIESNRKSLESFEALLKDKSDEKVISNISDKLKQVAEDLKSMTQSVDAISEKMKAAKPDVSESQHKEAKSNIISDLKKLAIEASENGDFKFVYQVERAISAIEAEE